MRINAALYLAVAMEGGLFFFFDMQCLFSELTAEVQMACDEI